ncbi:MAG: nucleoside phosphorylase [Bacteroidota bacterium]
MAKIPESELILNPDGSVYHLHLRPEHIAPNIILVGDQERVPQVSQYFDHLDLKVQKREFVSHIGKLRDQSIMVISTGIGTDNIDIVLNELDALVNIDLQRREVKEQKTALNFIRIGTSGALQPDIPVDSYLISAYGIGLDGLMHYYDFSNNANEHMVQYEFFQQLGHQIAFPVRPYLAEGDPQLIERIGVNMLKGITVTCTGFYGPQGRSLRGPIAEPQLLSSLQNFRYRDLQITNFEMETAGIYGLARLLGHRAISCNAILANRHDKSFSETPKETVDRLIRMVLSRI